MEQKSGKYWPGVVLLMLFAVLCARRVLPELWNQMPWQVIPTRPEPIPLFGNSSPEETGDTEEENVKETPVRENTPEEESGDMLTAEKEESGKQPEMQTPVEDKTEDEPEMPSVQQETEKQEEPWPETMLPGERININRASVADLTRLPLVGEKRARAIAAWRRKNGPFREAEDLLGVQGIGAATLEQLKRYITLD